MAQNDRLNGLTGNTAMKVPVRTATTAAITLAGEQIVDGVACVAGDRVLVKDQANAVNNGIYDVDTGAWSRSRDCDGAGDLVTGSLVRVVSGTTTGDNYWECTAVNPITAGTTALTFSIASSALQGVSALAQQILTSTTAAQIRALLVTPSNTEAILQTLADAKGDLIVATAADAFTRLGAPSDDSFWIAAAGQFAGWTATKYQRPTFAPNPFFQIDQRVNAATSRADDTYCVDRWYVLTQSNPIAVTQQADQADGLPFNVRLTQSNATPQRMGIACILEGKDAKYLRGKAMLLCPRIRCSSSQPIRAAIVEWTGTEDAVTSDVVADWTSSTYTPNNFFVNTGFAINCTVDSRTPAANTWTDFTNGSFGSIGSTTNNLILFIWTEGTAAQNVTLDVSKVRLTEGVHLGDIQIPRFADELMRCGRFFQKSFNYAVTPAQNAGLNSGELYFPATGTGAVTNRAQSFSFLPRMRNTGLTPNVTLTLFNPAAVNAQVRNVTDSADCTISVGSGAESYAQIVYTGSAGTVPGENMAVHWTADAEL